MSTSPVIEPSRTIAFDRAGRGEPLLLLHGLGGVRGVWEPVLPALVAQRDVIAVDLPGFGASPPVEDGVEPSPSELAARVADLLDDLGLERVHLGGNSLGGWVALELAKAGRGLSVTTLGAAGFWDGPLRPRAGRFSARAAAERWMALVPAVVRSSTGRKLLLSGTLGRPDRVPPAAAAMLIRAYATAPGFDAVNAAMRSRWLTGLEHVRCPMTLAWGDRDRLTAPPRVLPPRARLVRLPGCGHVPMWDDPALIAEVLLVGSRSVAR